PAARAGVGAAHRERVDPAPAGFADEHAHRVLWLVHALSDQAGVGHVHVGQADVHATPSSLASFGLLLGMMVHPVVPGGRMIITSRRPSPAHRRPARVRAGAVPTVAWVALGIAAVFVAAPLIRL